MVVWDEAHWGENARSGRALLTGCKRRNIPVLGLTATPREPAKSRFKIAYSMDFGTLVRDGYLSRPIPEDPVSTHVRWRASRSRGGFDFNLGSLEQLGTNKRRNILIVDHYARNARKYDKTVVFACSIRHAQVLAELFREHGIAAREVHSALMASNNVENTELFRSGEIRVLVNVAMLTHGVDFPDCQSVFLCRPTLSDILFSQMVGRGARRDERSGKTSFYVVEFTDNIQKFGDQLVTGRKYFKGSAGGAENKQRNTRGRRIRVHSFDPCGTPRWIPDSDKVPEGARNLWYRENQTFGIELELTSKAFRADMESRDWEYVAEEIRLAIQRDLNSVRVADRTLQNYGDPRKDYSVWNVERDNSAGWEVSSPILMNRPGFEEVVEVCSVLEDVAKDLGLRVNYRTGMHVHLGWMSPDYRDVKYLIRLVKHFEPGLGTLVGASRIVRFDGRKYDLKKPNSYCRPISVVFPKNVMRTIRSRESLERVILRSRQARNCSVNLTSLYGSNTIEIRLHNGTLEAAKILQWVSLWQQVVWAAQYKKPKRLSCMKDCKVIRPKGDIVALQRRFLPPEGHSEFRKRLDDRRRQVARLWRDRHELQRWLRYEQNWEE